MMDWWLSMWNHFKITSLKTKQTTDQFSALKNYPDSFQIYPEFPILVNNQML